MKFLTHLPLSLLVLATLMTGCRGDETTDKVTDAAPPPAAKIEETPKQTAAPTTILPPSTNQTGNTTAQTIKEINPFSATYQGQLPCQPCQGTKLETTLRLTEENRYFLTIRTIDTGEERYFSGQYRISADKKFIQLDDNADTLTFMLGQNFLEARLPDGTTGKRDFPNKNYQLERQEQNLFDLTQNS